MTITDTTTTVGELVVQRPARSRLFQRLGIDFCCGGKKSLADACHAKGLDPQSVLQVLLASEDAPAGNEVDVAGMTATQLCDHIERTHHTHLKAELPRLHKMIAKVAAVHGERHPYMRDVLGVYTGLMNEMTTHMMKEEGVLFPAIRSLDAGTPAPVSPCGGTITHPIDVMESEHESAGAALEKLRVLTNGYAPPADACNTFRASLDGLRELEVDMHQHVHKENNVLFPRAIALEEKASKACTADLQSESASDPMASAAEPAPADHAPLKRHASLVPFSRDHYVGLVQSQHLLKAAAEDDTSRRAVIADFIDAWALEVEPHFSDEERLLRHLMSGPDAARFDAEHAAVRSLATQAVSQRRKISPDAGWMRELGQTLHDHIRWEERHLFPAIENSATPQQLDLLREQTEQVEAGRPRSLRP